MRKGEEVIGTIGQSRRCAFAPLKDIDGAIIGAIEAMISRKQFIATFDILSEATVLVAGLSVSIALILALAFAHLSSGRIEELAESIRKINAGDYDVEIKVTGKDEIGRLAESFRTLMSGVTEKMDELDNISEELKKIREMMKK